MSGLTRRALFGRASLALSGAGAAAALAGCSSSTGVRAEDGFAAGDGTVTLVDPAQRTPLPSLSGTTLDGNPLDLSQYKGKVIVLNVWGSWCPPCRHEAPQLVAASAKTTGVAQFVGIDTRDTNKAAAQAFVRNARIGYPSLYDPDGALLLRLRSVPPKAIPSTLVVDRQGRRRAGARGGACHHVGGHGPRCRGGQVTPLDVQAALLAAQYETPI